MIATSGVTLGMTAVFAPEFNAAGGVQYQFDAGSIGTITPRLDVTHRSSVHTEAVNNPLTRLPQLTLANARLTWESYAADWSVSLAVTNLFDEFYAEGMSARPNAPYFAGSYRVGQPRQWQLSVRRNF